MKLYDTELEKPFILPNFIKLETFDLIIKVLVISSFFCERSRGHGDQRFLLSCCQRAVFVRLLNFIFM